MLKLAKLVGISTLSCWNHTQRLFKIGAILDVRARINPGMVQRETIVLVGVVLDRSTPDSFQAFERQEQGLRRRARRRDRCHWPARPKRPALLAKPLGTGAAATAGVVPACAAAVW